MKNVWAIINVNTTRNNVKATKSLDILLNHVYAKSKIQNLKILTVKKLDQGDEFIQPALIKRKKQCKSNNINRVSKKEFHISVEINDAPINVLIDTGTDVNIISEKEADSINIKCSEK